MRTLVILSGLLILTATTLAEEKKQTPVEVRIALALTQGSKVNTPPLTVRTPLCSCGASCSCIGGECGSPNCPSLGAKSSSKTPGPLEWAVYKVQYNKAIQQNKPLLIWVGETCPSCESSWTEYIHSRLSEYDGNKGAEFGPEVIVAKPDGLGGMDLIARLDGIPNKAAVSSLLSAKKETAVRQPLQLQSTIPVQQFIPQPQFFAPPMMPMGGFGGFGGGCAGGFCGRGG